MTSWYQIQDKPRSGQRRFHGAHTARIAASCNIRKQKRPAGEFPLQVLWRRSAAGTVKSICHPRGKKGCGEPCAALRRARRIAAARRGKRKGESSGDAGCGGRRPKTQKRPARGSIPRGPLSAPIEKRPPRARRPALPQPCAAVLSAKAGLTAGFGMGPGDPRLCGRARGGRSPAALIFEPARNPCPGRPWRPHGGHGQKIAHRARCFNRGCEELGLLVPLG